MAMYARNPIVAELAEIAPGLASASAALPYQVPQGYFEALEPLALVQEPGFLEGSDLPFQAPTGYFEYLPQQLLQRIRLEDTAATMDALPQVQKEPALVVPMKAMRKWVIYAAAAVLMGVLVTGSFLFSDKPVEQMKEQYQLQDLGAALDAVPDAALEQYLEENQTIAIDDVLTSPIQKLPVLSDHIQSISNEKLNDYLEDNSHLESAVAE